MGGRRKHTLEEVRDYLLNDGYILVSKGYHRHQDKLEMICDKGHSCQISFKAFKNGNRCPICACEKRSEKQRIPFEEVKRFVENCNSELLSTTEDYKSGKSKLLIRCPKGHEFKSAFISLNKTNCGCPICRNESVGNKFRTNGLDVYNLFIEKGLKPQFKPNEYINAKQKLPFICPDHESEGIKFTTKSDVEKNRFRCKSCYLEYNKGKNHWNWQGGISNLSEHLRLQINDWKLASIKFYDYKCAITEENNKDLEIHHLYNFHKIIEETLQYLDLPLYSNINKYSDGELNLIETTFQILHNKYGYGIPLRHDIHQLYHMEYGFNNNSPEQFEEFKVNYYKGIYKNKLNTILTERRIEFA